MTLRFIIGKSSSLESMPASHDGTDAMESKGYRQEEPSKGGSRGVKSVMHRVSNPNDLKDRGVNIHVAAVLGAGGIESPDDFHHIPLVFEIAEELYFLGQIG